MCSTSIPESRTQHTSDAQNTTNATNKPNRIKVARSTNPKANLNKKHHPTRCKATSKPAPQWSIMKSSINRHPKGLQLHACMYVCMYVCMYACLYVLRTYVHMHVYVCMYVCMYGVRTNLCMCACMYVCVTVCMCVLCHSLRLLLARVLSDLLIAKRHPPKSLLNTSAQAAASC